MSRTARPELERFLPKVSIADTGCWEWTGARKSNGYGVFGTGSSRDTAKTEYAHRYMMKMMGVEIPPGCDVCHTCDNPSCVRPSHLWVGTRADNMADAIQKQRWRPYHPRKGEKNGRAKLTREIVEQIRQRRAAGDTQTALAQRYGVGQSQIARIVHNKQWT